MAMSLLPDGDLHLSDTALDYPIRPKEGPSTSYWPNNEVKPLRIGTASNIELRRNSLGFRMTVKHRSNAISESLRELQRTELLIWRDRETTPRMVRVGKTECQDRIASTIKGDETTRFFRVGPSRMFEHGVRHLERDHDTFDTQALIGVINILGTYQEPNTVMGEEPRIESSLVIRREPRHDPIRCKARNGDVPVRAYVIDSNRDFRAHWVASVAFEGTRSAGVASPANVSMKSNCSIMSA
jgi:hypothetical protein